MATSFPSYARAVVPTDPRAASWPPIVQASAAGARAAADAVPDLSGETGAAAVAARGAADDALRLVAATSPLASAAAMSLASATSDAGRALVAADSAEQGVPADVTASLLATPPLDYVSLDPVASPTAMGFGFDAEISNAGSAEVHLLIRPRGATTALFGGYSLGWYVGTLPSGELALTEASGLRRPLGVSLTPDAWQWVSVSLGATVRAIVGDLAVGPTVTPSMSLTLGRVFGAAPSVASLPRFVGDVALIAFTAGPQTLANRNAMLSGRYPGRLPLTFRPDGLSADIWREQGDRRRYLGGPANLVARSTCGRSRRHPCAALFPSISDL